MAVRDSLSELLYDSDALEAEKNKAEARKARLEKELGALALKLHESRTGAASGFAAAIQESLRSLELEHSVFDVAVSKVQQNATGEDAVTFLFSSSGAAPVEVARCASGGELSRIMLSLKAMMARYTAMPSMVFDEIDTGVSGSAADSMGSMICRMGEDMQVFAITHLPQVAAKGHSHFLVSKSLEEGRAVTEISRIEGERRVEEIARMLSGSDITPQAMENARVLLGKAAL